MAAVLRTRVGGVGRRRPRGGRRPRRRLLDRLRLRHHAGDRHPRRARSFGRSRDGSNRNAVAYGPPSAPRAVGSRPTPDAVWDGTRWLRWDGVRWQAWDGTVWRFWDGTQWISPAPAPPPSGEPMAPPFPPPRSDRTHSRRLPRGPCRRQRRRATAGSGRGRGGRRHAAVGLLRRIGTRCPGRPAASSGPPTSRTDHPSEVSSEANAEDFDGVERLLPRRRSPAASVPARGWLAGEQDQLGRAAVRRRRRRPADDRLARARRHPRARQR